VRLEPSEDNSMNHQTKHGPAVPVEALRGLGLGSRRPELLLGERAETAIPLGIGHGPAGSATH
jgi:hypothetical protein